eukprot:gene31785-42913_t
MPLPESQCPIFGDAHEEGAFVSASHRQFPNWRPEKPRIINRHERMQAQISHA